MIKIEVQSTRAVIRSQKPLTVGLRGAKAHFAFGQDWDGLIKTAVFRQGDKTVAVADIGQEVTIPWEVLTVPGVPVQIGIYGIDGTGNIAIPTVWAVTQPVRPGTELEGDPSTEPTPGLWEQMQGQLGSLEQLDTNDQSSLVAAVNEANRAVYVVTAERNENGGYKVNKTLNELEEAWISGKALVCLLLNLEIFLPLALKRQEEFVFVTTAQNTEHCVRVNRDGVEYRTIILTTDGDKLPNPKKLTFIGEATAEYDGSEEVAVEIPTKVSQLTNDKGYLTKAPVTSVNGQNGAVKLSVPLRVTIEELANGVVQSDPPYEELAEFRNEGHLLYCQHGRLELPLAAVTPHLYIFSCVQGGKVHTVMIGPSSVTVTNAPLASGSGTDGITPHIGENGNWFIGDTDTGMPSRGEDAPQEAVLYTPQELTDEQKAQVWENIGVNSGALETIINFKTTETVSQFNIPIDTDELVEKLRNMTEFRLTIHIPRDTTDTETSTNGDVTFGVYQGWSNTLLELKGIIPAPTVTYTNYSRTYAVTFCNGVRVTHAPIFITHAKENQTASALTSGISKIGSSAQSIQKGHYFYITGTQPMAKGTTVTMEVRV